MQSLQLEMLHHRAVQRLSRTCSPCKSGELSYIWVTRFNTQSKVDFGRNIVFSQYSPMALSQSVRVELVIFGF